jgi:hypothetical protein
MDADMPPFTKGIALFLRFAYVSILKLFNYLQSERYFENRYMSCNTIKSEYGDFR